VCVCMCVCVCVASGAWVTRPIPHTMKRVAGLCAASGLRGARFGVHVCEQLVAKAGATC